MGIDDSARWGGEETVALREVGETWGTIVEGVFGVGVDVGVDYLLTGAVAVVVVHAVAGAIDRELLEVGRAHVAVDLRVCVGEEASVEERVVREVDTADDVAGGELGGVRIP